MRTPNTKEFKTQSGTVKVMIQQLGGRSSLLLSMRLAKVIFPALAGVAGARGGDKLAMLTAFAGAAEKISPAEFDSLFCDLLKGQVTIFDEPNGQVYTDNGFEKIDEIFKGSVLEIYKIFLFALEVNYQDFFQMLRASKPGAQTPTAAPAQST